MMGFPDLGSFNLTFEAKTDFGTIPMIQFIGRQGSHQDEQLDSLVICQIGDVSNRESTMPPKLTQSNNSPAVVFGQPTSSSDKNIAQGLGKISST